MTEAVEAVAQGVGFLTALHHGGVDAGYDYLDTLTDEDLDGLPFTLALLVKELVDSSPEDYAEYLTDLGLGVEHQR